MTAVESRLALTMSLGYRQFGPSDVYSHRRSDVTEKADWIDVTWRRTETIWYVETLESLLYTLTSRGSALAFEDRTGDVGLVHDECEHRAIAPAAEEEVTLDVDASIGQGAR